MSAPQTIELTREALFERVWREPLSTVALQLGLSASGLAKICDRTAIPYPSRGHWGKVKTGRAASPPRLPPPPDGVEDALRISPGQAVGRRASPRLPLEERRVHLLNAAAQIIVREGLHAVSIKRVARDVGLTAPRVYHFFPSVDDLLIELARRELQAVRAAQQQRIDTATRPAERLRLSTVTYLREAAGRGGLLQALQAAPAVRKGLRREQRAIRAANTEVVAGRFSHSHGVPDDIARAATTILTSAVLRTGRLLARGRLSLEVAEDLAVEIVEAGNRRLAARFHAASASDVDHP